MGQPRLEQPCGCPNSAQTSEEACSLACSLASRIVSHRKTLVLSVGTGGARQGRDSRGQLGVGLDGSTRAREHGPDAKPGGRLTEFTRVLTCVLLMTCFMREVTISRGSWPLPPVQTDAERSGPPSSPQKTGPRGTQPAARAQGQGPGQDTAHAHPPSASQSLGAPLGRPTPGACRQRLGHVTPGTVEKVILQEKGDGKADISGSR